MKAVVRAYGEVLRLVRLLPPQTRSYYSRYARENFVAYADEHDPAAIRDLLRRAYDHSCWVLNKNIQERMLSKTFLTSC
ncbi:hypothetical protein O6H91_Y033000 [Diphasiastrum complanatum]|nr:hypothetical protein O6H91_Y033000 [Diphasiastrum complanatum]